MRDLNDAVVDAIWPGYGLDRKVAAERAIAVIAEALAQEIENYGSDTHPPHSGFTTCLRCDIHAAYNNAAAMVRKHKKGN